MKRKVVRYIVAVEIKLNILKSFNVQIWCGLKENYNNDKRHTIEEVYEICDEFMLDGDCVSVTKTSFRYTNGSEDGVVIGYIQYPRFPRTEHQITERAIKLAKKLMIGLGQYRITVTTPTESIMLSNKQI